MHRRFVVAPLRAQFTCSGRVNREFVIASASFDDLDIGPADSIDEVDFVLRLEEVIDKAAPLRSRGEQGGSGDPLQGLEEALARRLAAGGVGLAHDCPRARFVEVLEREKVNVTVRDKVPGAKKLVDASAYYPQAAIVSGWAASNEFHAKNREVLQRVVRAWSEGSEISKRVWRVGRRVWRRPHEW